MRIFSAVAEVLPDGRKISGMAIDHLLPVVKIALERAALDADEIDLIVTLSLSPDRIAVDPAIIGPRIGHPLQRAIGATRAYVFDLMDSSLAKALHVIDVFGHAQGYRNVLLLRCENGAGLDQTGGGGLRIADGAAAMIGVPDCQSQLVRRSIEQVEPLVLALNPHIHHSLDIKASLRFAPPTDFAVRYSTAVDSALRSLDVSADASIVESWFPQLGGPSNSFPTCTGPFGLPVALSGLLAKGGNGLLTAVSFDPFGPGVDAVSIAYGGDEDA